MRTALTTLLSTRVPVVLAPMAGASGGLLASSVAKGGGFGFIAGGAAPLKTMQSEIVKARESLGLAQNESLPLGIGLMIWRLEAPFGDPTLAAPFLNATLDAKPKAIWLSFGTTIDAWVKNIRAAEKERKMDRSNIFVNVGTVADAKKALDMDIDVLVAQGLEAGGHATKTEYGLPLLSFLATVHRLIQQRSSPGPILLGAGGIATGSQLVSLLPFASGAVIGTQFLTSPESLYSDAQKDLLIRSSGEDTIKTLRFDEARNTLGWGPEIDGRGLKNLTSEEEGGGGREKYDAAVKTGDVSRIVTWAGTSVGLTTSKASAEEIVRGIGKEADATLNQLLQLRDSA